MELIYLLYLIIGIALGALGVYFAMRSHVQAAKQRTDLAEQQRHEESNTLREQLKEQQDSFREQLKALQESSQQQLREQRDAHREQLSEQRETQQKQLQQQMDLLREQMQTASERVLKERANELSQVNTEQLSKILTPLQQDLKQMRSQTEQMQKDHDDSLRELKTAIQLNMERERVMGEQTERLAQALTGENKVQGNFGELRLGQILDQMGLERGLQYDTQETMRDLQGRAITSDEGKRLIPDAILHFPDGRDVIIDSKMSFTAFVDYMNCSDDSSRTEALRRHIASMRQHVRELSQKQYFRYAHAEGGRLDFVLMYVFQEGALQLALQNDTTLWKEAYDQGVVISGSQSLYMTLRVLELTWKQTRQVENQEKIMQCANLLVERVQLFAERFERVGEMLDKTRRSFDELTTVTAPSGPSITIAARNLIRYGAQENKKKKSIAQTTLFDNADTDTEQEDSDASEMTNIQPTDNK